MRILLRLALLPVVAGLSYEVIKFAGRSKSRVMKVVSMPGMWLQKLTTREPDDEMLEVAIASMKAALDGVEAAAPAKQYVKEEKDRPEDAGAAKRA